jgi:hypothetical protein
MHFLNKTILVTLVLCYTALASVCVYGQSKEMHPFTKHKQNLTLGFKAGKDFLYHPVNLLANRRSIHYAISSTLFLRKPINDHFNIEGGIKYSVVQNAGNSVFYKDLSDHYIAPKKTFNVSIPITIQYYFLPEKSRIRPFIGGGLQSGFNANGNNITPFSADAHPDYTSQSGTQYISILFTQGVTFEINTKIQVNQSFHFIPDNTNRAFGIDVGIGFKLP